MTIFRALPVALAAMVLASSAPAAPAAARPAAQQQICFPGVPGIEDCIDPAFSAYWRANGGLPIFGYPIGPGASVTPEGAEAPVTAQWFERNRLELHPANRPQYRVQLGRLGAERLAQLGRDHSGDGEAGPLPGCLWFAETRHNVCDQAPGAGFKSYWEANGLRIAGLSRFEQSLALFGLPLTAANPEPGPDGALIVTQWFERARFEWQADQAGQFKVYLGLLGNEVVGGAPAPAPAAAGPAFGVEITRGTVAASVGALPGLGATLVRYNLTDWNTVEPRRGQRDWSPVDGPAAELAAISAAGGVPQVVVNGHSPAWARRFPDKACGPIKPEALPAFADFVGELVRRYSAPPYNVRYWEIGNEPDGAFAVLSGESGFGCWGDQGGQYFGGEAYGEMLKVVYPAIKAADPNAIVMNGGLLLECDPTSDAACGMGRFLEGMLRAGGGEGFDILAYHSYVYWSPERKDWDLVAPRWGQRGGVLAGKLAFIRETMARYGVDKPVLMNEGALLCYQSDPVCGPMGFFQDQANYAVRTLVRGHELGLYGVLWYTHNGPGWQESGLLDAGQQPRPVYNTLRFLSGLLAGATHEGATRDGALEVHRFRKGQARYTIAWTNDGSTRELTIPAGARARYGLAGEAQALAQPLSVGFEPIIVESAAP